MPVRLNKLTLHVKSQFLEGSFEEILRLSRKSSVITDVCQGPTKGIGGLHVKYLPFLDYQEDYTYCSREGNGTPLQHSCLENPMDGGVW